MVFLQNVFYSKKCEIVFSLNVKDNNIGPCSHNIRLSFFYKMLEPIKMLHKTVKMVVFFVKNNENTYPKGRALMQMYRVVPITKRGNWRCRSVCQFVKYRRVNAPYKEAAVKTTFTVSKTVYILTSSSVLLDKKYNMFEAFGMLYLSSKRDLSV